MLYLVTIIILIASGIRWLLGKRRVGKYNDKFVFITGCDTGFGNLLAKRLDQLGFYVFAGCLTDNGCMKLKLESSPNVVTVKLDVTDEASISNAVDTVKKTLPKGKGLWALVNNAGITGNTCHVGWLTKADYEQVLAVNLYGVINTTKAFLPLIRRTPGRIVNMASMSGIIGIGFAPYTVSKFGVEGFSDCLRHELYQMGISVHIIEPGFYATTLVNRERTREVYEASYQALDQETKNYYGREYFDTACEKGMEHLDRNASSRLYDVINAYEHAITSKYPKARYLVGKLYLVLGIQLATILPEWMYLGILGAYRSVPKGRDYANDRQRGDQTSSLHAEAPLMNV